MHGIIPLVLAAVSASCVAATPVERAAGIKVSVNKKVNLDEPLHVKVAHEKLRAANRSKNGGNEKRNFAVSATNTVVSYTQAITIGGRTYNDIVDTGSSNTWVGANGNGPSCSGPATEVSYGSGSFSGHECSESVTIGSVTVKNVMVGVATSSTGFSGVDGIVGYGPEDLTEGTVNGVSEVPTIMQDLTSQGLISTNLLGVYFAPNTNGNNVANGELSYGSVDTSKTTSGVGYSPVTSTSPASYYWGITFKLTAGSTTLTSSDAGIVDTGTTLILIATNWFNTYKGKIPSAKVDSNSGLLRFPKSSLSSVPTLTFTFSGGSYALNNYAQLVEQGLYGDFGLSSSYYYSWVADLGNNSGTGLDAIIGQKFLERYYSVFDTTNNRIGFASTSNSNPTSPP